MADGGIADGGTPALVRFENVSKRYGDVPAVNALSLDIRSNEFFALLGPSGCGKTTLLRLLAGFEQPSEGRILLDGEDISAVPPHRRPVNMMFQSYALFPHLTVEGNIAFGLRQEDVGRRERAERVAEMLTLTHLQGFEKRKVGQLSGGQRQRVALAHALLRNPRILLLDEATSALDTESEAAVQAALAHLRRGRTTIVIAHRLSTVRDADLVVVMSEGRAVEQGTHADLLSQGDLYARLVRSQALAR
jgi:putrescine transport system ATP-binding protein